MKTLTLGIVLQWPNYFQNFVFYKLLEFWSLEVGCSYEEDPTYFCMCLAILTPPQCQNCFSALYKQAELTKEEVKLGHPGNGLIQYCFLSVYFDRDPLKSIWNPLCWVSVRKERKLLLNKSLKPRWILLAFWYSCNPIILHKLVLW